MPLTNIRMVTIMKKKIGKLFAAFSMLGLLASCAQTGSIAASSADARGAAENASTYVEHDRLARQYEAAAKELRAKAEERKALLQHYEEKSYLYGRQAQDRRAHTWALLNRYERAAAETIKLAAFHRKEALELARDHQDIRSAGYK